MSGERVAIDFDELSELLKTLREMGVKRTEYSIVSPWTRPLPPPSGGGVDEIITYG